MQDNESLCNTTATLRYPHYSRKRFESERLAEMNTNSENNSDHETERPILTRTHLMRNSSEASFRSREEAETVTSWSSCSLSYLNRSANSVIKDQQPSTLPVCNLNQNDVLLVRASNHHTRFTGNMNLERLAQSRVQMYAKCNQVERYNMEKALVHEIQNLNPPGRFLLNSMYPNQWIVAEEKFALFEVSQIFHDCLIQLTRSKICFTSPTLKDGADHTVSGTESFSSIISHSQYSPALAKDVEGSQIHRTYDQQISLTENKIHDSLGVDHTDKIDNITHVAETVSNAAMNANDSSQFVRISSPYMKNRHVIYTARPGRKKYQQRARIPSRIELVSSPNENDILLGRGGNNNRYSGNEKLRELAFSRTDVYAVASKKEKCIMSRALIDEIQNLDPPGRFLLPSEHFGQWIVAEDLAAREKVSQVFRDCIKKLSKKFDDEISTKGRPKQLSETLSGNPVSVENFPQIPIESERDRAMKESYDLSTVQENQSSKKLSKLFTPLDLLASTAEVLAQNERIFKKF